MGLFAVLFLLDYLFTFYGISRGFIKEGNPLMGWLFELPFIWGLGIRLLMCIFFLCIFYYGRKTRAYAFAKRGIPLLYFMVMLLHFFWIGSSFV